ncbi:hypothetical protein [Flintibacter muris]|uniref:hypothetical protein n=1 Tax=Flintibacter muris TaxID=2941327 RepID=UPI00203DE828|nr:hypothetical protein [Flintibacter muris]
MRRPHSQAGRAWAGFLLLFGLIFIRFCCYGLEYYPQLDDYIQLHNYAAYHPDIWAFIQNLGLLAARPAAGLLDIFFWSRLWPVLIAGCALIAGLYAGSAVLFRQVWGRYFPVGWLFLVLYALVPLGLEGTYWLSAANRVVPGVFFAALAMRLFQQWCEGGQKGFLIAYFLVQLASMSFYEQGLVLSAAGVILVALLELWNNRGRALWAALTFVNAGLYLAFTSAFANSALYAGRAEVVLPWQEGWRDWVFLPVLRQMRDAFLKGGVYTAVKGFLRGARLIWADGRWLWLALVLALCGGLFLLVRGERSDRSRGREVLLALTAGLLMALAPATIFFVLANPWFSLRGTVASFCGLALMGDALVRWLLGRLKKRGEVTAALCAVLALAFCVAAVSELHDYKAVCEADQAVMAAILAGTDNGAALPQKGEALILGVEPCYLEEQNFYFHEHIHGVTESRWALTGGLQCISGRGDFPYVTPLPAAVDAQTLGGMDLTSLWLYDREGNTVRAVTPRLDGDGNYDLLTENGSLAGRVTGEGLVRSGK